MSFTGFFINQFKRAAWFREVDTRLTDLEGAPPGATAWGDITGTLSVQTDLDTALSGKAASTHTHAISDVTSLTAELAGKANAAGTNFVIENRTSDPGAPSTGQIWLRTDL
jgi:hypothetical protein